jgi:hypothetical protein
MKMDSYTAIGILDGFVEPESALDVIRAYVFIAEHGPRGVLAGSGTQRALYVAAYAKEHGEECAAEALESGDL